MIVKNFRIERAVAQYQFSHSELERAISYAQDALFRELGKMVAEAMLRQDAKLLTLTLEFKREEYKANNSYDLYAVQFDRIVYSVDGVAVMV